MNAEVRSCRSKRGYLNQVDALLAADVKPGHPVLSSYRCRVCRNWHLTSKVKKK